jgi:hypothetical protein
MPRNGRTLGLIASAGALLTLAPVIASSQVFQQVQSAQSVQSVQSAGSGNALRAAPGTRAFTLRSTPFGGQGAGVIGAPFSAVETTETITKFIDGNRVVQTQTSRLFRDSEGRIRLEHTFPRFYAAGGAGAPDGVPTEHTSVTITDAVKGKTFTLNSYDKSAQEMFPFPMERIQPPVPMPDPQMQVNLPGLGMGLNPNDPGVKVTQLGDKTIDGVRVTGIRVENGLPAGRMGNEKPITVVAEQWFSTELGVVVLSTQKSSIGSETTTKLDQIVRSEPDPALFTIPAGYTMRERPAVMELRSTRKPEGQ